VPRQPQKNIDAIKKRSWSSWKGSPIYDESGMSINDGQEWYGGPPGMTASVRRALREVGVGNADIHEETFTL
jgi:predicted ferric reductase